MKHLPGAREGERGGSEGDVRGGAIGREAIEKGTCVRAIKGEEVRRDHPIEYFLSTGIESMF